MARRSCFPHLLVTALVLVLITASGCATGGPDQAETAFPPAPEVTLNGLDGSASQLSDYRGSKVILVNFWGLRCQNCIEEMPFLERLHNKYGSRGLVVLGINTDGVGADQLNRFMPMLPVKISYPVILDTDFQLAESFGMQAAPFTILVAKDGTIRYAHEGYEEEIESTYVDKIEILLAE